MLKESLRRNINHYGYVIYHSYVSHYKIIKESFKKRMERKDVEPLDSQNYPQTGISCGWINTGPIDPNSFKTLYLLMLLTSRT